MRVAMSLVCVLVLAGCLVKSGRPNRAERRDDRRDARVEATTGWDKLGERWIEGKRDRDAIHVGRDEGRYTRIMLVAEHSALELFDIVVTFGNGDTYSPDTRLVFDQSTRSRVIDLPGGARAIKRVDLRYANLPGGGRAQLEVWGK